MNNRFELISTTESVTVRKLPGNPYSAANFRITRRIPAKMTFHSFYLQTKDIAVVLASDSQNLYSDKLAEIAELIARIQSQTTNFLKILTIS